MKLQLWLRSVREVFAEGRAVSIEEAFRVQRRGVVIIAAQQVLETVTDQNKDTASQG